MQEIDVIYLQRNLPIRFTTKLFLYLTQCIWFRFSHR